MSEPIAKRVRTMSDSKTQEEACVRSTNGSEANGLKNGAVENGGKTSKDVNGADVEDNSVLRVKRLSENATLPTRGSASAAGKEA